VEFRIALAAVVVALFGLDSEAQERPAADLIITNAAVWTADKERPKAEAVAVIGERIVAVGSSARVDMWRGGNTRVIDARGRLLLPGFNDSHVHFVSGGMQLDNVDLKVTSGPEEFARRIAEHANKLPKGEWVLGGDWDEQRWSPAVLPTRQLIDQLTPDRAVFVNRYDGHMALANSVGLRLAGVTAKTPDPPGGVIVRDSKGNPTGLLKDAAMSFVTKVVPPISRERRMRAVRRALEHAAALGVTSVQDMNPEYADIAAYAELAEKNALTTRIYAAPPLENWNDQAKIGARRAFGSAFLRVGAVKGYMDGSLGSATAYFFEPFQDDPKNRGLLMNPVALIRERLTSADKAGLQLCVHAIGDQAISLLLDEFERLSKVPARAERRLRVEHAQHMAAKDFKRFADLKVIASMQPYHAIDDGRWAEKRIGKRIRSTYAFRTFLDNGVRLAFGTDWSVAPLDPMWTIYAAVTRRTLDDKNPDGWVPEEKITVEETVEAYTVGSAYAEFQEAEKGSITVGKLADMVLLSDNILQINPVAIKDVKVDLTVVGGKITHSRLSD
jgi:predicted amidohydrolase YtcJ